LSVRAGNNPVQILVIFEIEPVGVGSYQAGPVGNEVTSTPTGITLDGIGHWQTQAGAGTMSIDELSSAGAAGRVDAKLVKEADAFTLRGSWRCTGSPGPPAAASAG
jgi:hypothetical protein